MNKLYFKDAAFAQWTSLKSPGSTFNLPGEVPVSFEKVPVSVVSLRQEAYVRYLDRFEDLIPKS